MSREAIYEAVFALATGLSWTGAAGPTSFVNPMRRVRTFSEIREWPTLSQAEHDEAISARTNIPTSNTFNVTWLVYHNVGKDKSVIPASESNAILDAIDGLFPIDNSEGSLQTLGGLVHRVSVSGRIIKEHGDLQGQALLMIPLKILTFPS